MKNKIYFMLALIAPFLIVGLVVIAIEAMPGLYGEKAFGLMIFIGIPAYYLSLVLGPIFGVAILRKIGIKKWWLLLYFIGMVLILYFLGEFIGKGK